MGTNSRKESHLADTLTSTKLLMPSPKEGLVPRPRLFEQLKQGLDKKLTLISAPAGYGKTMLLSAWAHEYRIPIAWISLEESENDLARFYAYLVAALEEFIQHRKQRQRLSLRWPFKFRERWDYKQDRQDQKPIPRP